MSVTPRIFPLILPLLLLCTGNVLVGQSSGSDTSSPATELLNGVRQQNEGLPALRCRQWVDYGPKALKEEELLYTDYFYRDLIYGTKPFLIDRSVMRFFQNRRGYLIESQYMDRNRNRYKFNLHASHVSLAYMKEFPLEQKITLPASVLTGFDQLKFMPNLFALNVFPELLSSPEQTLDVQAVESGTGDKTLKKIRVPQCVSLFKSDLHVTWNLFLDPETDRFVRFSVQWNKKERFRGVVKEWLTIQGVRLPARVRVMNKHGDLFYNQSFTNVKLLQNASEMIPYWVNDPAVPDSTSPNLDTLRKQLASDGPAPHLYIQYVHQYISNHMHEMYQSNEVAPDVIPKLQEAVQNHPTSGVLQEYLGAMWAKLDKYDQVTTLEASSPESDTSNPFLHFLLAQHHQKENNETAAQPHIKQLRNHSNYQNLAKQFSLQQDIKRCSSAEQCLSVLSSYAKQESSRNRLTILSAIAPPLSKKYVTKRWLPEQNVSFLKEIQKLNDSPAITLLLARAFAKKGRFEEAGRLYRSVSDHPVLEADRKRFARHATRNEIPLPNKLIQHLSSTKPLLKQALLQIDKEDPEDVFTVVDQINEVLTDINRQRYHDKISVPGFLRRGDGPEHVQKIVKFLLKRNQKKRAITLVRKLLRWYPGAVKTNVIEQIHNGNRMEKFKTVRYMVKGGFGTYFPYKDVPKLFNKRRKSGSLQRSDYRMLAAATWEFVFRKQHDTNTLKEIKQHLQQGIQKYPTDFFIRERLADLCFTLEQYRSAREHYQKWLTHFQNTTRKPEQVKRNLNASSSIGVTWEQDFRVRSPVPSKLLRTYRQTNELDQGIAYLKSYVESNPNVKIILNFSRALQAIGKNDLRQNVVKKGFITYQKNQNSEASNSDFKNLTNQLLDLLENQNKFFRSTVVADIAISHILESQTLFNRNPEELKERKSHLQSNVDQQKIVHQQLKQYKKKPHRKKVEQAQRWIDQLGAKELKKREQAKTKLSNNADKFIPVLKTHRNHSNPEIRAVVNQILTNVIMDNYRNRLRDEYRPSSDEGVSCK